jgi:hypothetical protein
MWQWTDIFVLTNLLQETLACFWFFGIQHKVLTQNTGENIFTSKRPLEGNGSEPNIIHRHHPKKDKIMQLLNLRI